MELKNLNDRFIELYGNSSNTPRCFFAPGRVNLIGEHTDYNGGFVLPCAIENGTYLLIRRTSEPVVRLASTNMEFRTEIPLNDLSNKVGKEWVNYPLGIFDQFRQLGMAAVGFEMLYS
ncbi:MAG TPA: galactokinase family protein, partial [Bacteroidales bacterium]|nr:galactokinase family protein [Bacteroidales bacterium]